MSNYRTLLAATAALTLAVGCGPNYRSAFSYHFADNDENDLRATLERLPEAAHDDRPENSLGRPIAVASTHVEDGQGERQLVAFDVSSGEQLWFVAHDSATQPEILGDIVVVSSRNALHGFDLASGRSLWTFPLPDLAYVGATRDGATIYWSATVGALGGARRVGHVVAMDARSGGEIWRHEVQGVFGQPAAAGGMVFVPWERQNIAVLDEEDGNELARLRSTDDVIAWAFNHPTGIYYGGRGIYRLTHRSATGTRAESTHVRPALGELPRQPDSIWPDGFVPRPGTRSARGRIRVYFNPAPTPDPEGIHIEGDSYYFVYYRYVFAFDLEGNLNWTRILEQDVANAEAMPHGLLTVGEQGQMHLLDRHSGNDRWTRDLETPFAAVALDAAGFNPEGEETPERPLRQSLNEIVLDPDNRLVAARAYAVTRLAQIDEPEITRDLLDLYQQRSMPGALKEEIRQALRTRRSGQEFLMEALARRYDYLEDTQAPPLEAIVPALLEMNHADAVPALVGHMMDHETPASVLPEVVDAIVRLGGESAVPALRSFLIFYHADSQFAGALASQEASDEQPAVVASPEAQALARAAEGIFVHGGPEGRELLTRLSSEGARTEERIASYISGLYTAEAEAAARAAAQEEADAQAALAQQQAEEEANRPRQLSRQDIGATFADNADLVRDCIAGELERNPVLNEVRLVFILENDGTALADQLTVAPNSPELVECMRERIVQIEFPRFRMRRMRAQYRIAIAGAGSGAEDTQPAIRPIAEDAPWWAWAQRRAPEVPRSMLATVPAWWTEREPPVRAPVGPIPEESELPPGMVVNNGGSGTSGSGASGSGASGSGASGSGTSGSGTSGSGTSGSGTSGSGSSGGGWWTAASSGNEAEVPPPEEEEEED